MPSWKGNPNNNIPNPVQEGSNLSNRKKDHYKLSNIEENGELRAVQTRRDTDKIKNISFGLMDIDGVILGHLQKMQLSVVDDGDTIKVPLYYANPEKWKSIQKDGVFRDYNGKIILPAIVFYRESSERDQSRATFNRYLRYSVMKKYSSKNKYTSFSVLSGKNAPINEVYDVVYPDHMIFNYRFVIWTEYVEQMNRLVEKINFETEDYWGAPGGIRLRTSVDNYSHTVEVQDDADRVVKTEFGLNVHGYLLPEEYNIEFDRKPTTRKSLTPKKVILSTEVVSSDFDPDDTVDQKTINNWRSKRWPNLTIGEERDLFTGISLSKDEVIAINKTYSEIVGKVIDVTWHLPAPTDSSDSGEEGWQSYDADYYYLYSSGEWKRVPLALFSRFGS